MTTLSFKFRVHETLEIFIGAASLTLGLVQPFAGGVEVLACQSLIALQIVVIIRLTCGVSVTPSVSKYAYFLTFSCLAICVVFKFYLDIIYIYQRQFDNNLFILLSVKNLRPIINIISKKVLFILRRRKLFIKLTVRKTTRSKNLKLQGKVDYVNSANVNCSPILLSAFFLAKIDILDTHSLHRTWIIVYQAMASSRVCI